MMLQTTTSATQSKGTVTCYNHMNDDNGSGEPCCT